MFDSQASCEQARNSLTYWLKFNSFKVSRKYGEVKDHQKICKRCSSEFTYVGRENTKAFKQAQFCSRSCANSRVRKVTRYTSIAFKHWKKECVVCGEDNVVAVHHLDNNHKNNTPTNLVPLCPTHHQYMHSKYRAKIEDIVNKAVRENWGISLVGKQ